MDLHVVVCRYYTGVTNPVGDGVLRIRLLLLPAPLSGIL
jgi:hypothetical protein